MLVTLRIIFIIIPTIMERSTAMMIAVIIITIVRTRVKNAKLSTHKVDG